MKIHDEAPKSQAAIRCAKAAILLASVSRRNKKATIENQEDKEKEMMEREMGDLKVELVRERMKRKKIKVCELMELVLQVMVVLFVSSFVLMLAFSSN